MYIFLAVSALITLSLTTFKDNAFSSKILLILFILFSGLSYTNGWDWFGYKDYYDYIQNAGFSAVKEYNEFGIEYLYLIYMYLIGVTGAGFGFFIFINAIFVNLLIYKFCKLSAINYAFFMFIFFAVSYIRLELSTIRQGLAVALVMYSYSLLLNEKKKTALAYIILAVCFHRSAAIVLLFLPFISTINKKQVHYAIVFCALPFLLLSDTINNIFIHLLSYINSGILAAYTTKLIIYLSLSTTAKINPQAIVLLLLYLLSIYFCETKNKKQILFLNIMACQVVVSLYFTFLTQLIIMRMIYYFQVGWMCWVIILYKEYLKPRWFCFILIGLMVLAKLVLNFRYDSDRAVFFPYYNVISSIIDNDEYGRSREFILNKAEELPEG
jgi:hypothetical protein